jgi:hypothetical protein
MKMILSRLKEALKETIKDFPETFTIADMFHSIIGEMVPFTELNETHYSLIETYIEGCGMNVKALYYENVDFFDDDEEYSAIVVPNVEATRSAMIRGIVRGFSQCEDETLNGIQYNAETEELLFFVN